MKIALYWLSGVLGGASLFVIAHGVRAQEHPAAGDRRGNRCYDGRMWSDCGTPAPPPAHVTRMWQIADNANGAMVGVIDTAGVCLYVAVAPSMSAMAPVAIAAVPKTQLPKGTGCQ